MKTLISTRSLALNPARKLAFRAAKHSLANPIEDELQFYRKSQLILHIESLPLILQGFKEQITQPVFTLNLSSTQMTLKTHETTLTAPLTNNKKWLKVAFETEYEKIVVKGRDTMQRLKRSHFCPVFEEWKQVHGVQPITTVALNSFSEQQETIQLNQKTAFLRQKYSDKFVECNALKQKLFPNLSKRKDGVLNRLSSVSTEKTSFNFSKSDSATIEFETRRTNTALIRPKMSMEHSKRNKETLLQSKIGKSEKETTAGGDLSHLRDSGTCKYNFKWNLNISEEEFHIKKKRFDSQQPINRAFTENPSNCSPSKGGRVEEEVIEEIPKKEGNLADSNEFEGTFGSKLECSEGSVYESLYE